MLVLPSPALGRKNSASMNFREIPVGELIRSFGCAGLLTVDAEIPLAVFVHPMLLDIFVFRLS
jgi:hypothetical protein